MIKIDPRKRLPDPLAFLDRAAFGVVRDGRMGSLRRFYPEPHDRIEKLLGDLGNISHALIAHRGEKLAGDGAHKEWLSIVDIGAVWA